MSHHYINGKWVPGTGEAFSSINPSNNTPLWQGFSATKSEVIAAVSAAKNALPSWSRLSFEARKAHMIHFAKKVAQKSELLAEKIAAESGKPRWEARTEVNAVINKIDISIAAQETRLKEYHQPYADAISALHYKPHGVVAILGPFNFPAHLSNGHIIPALLAGNTLVYKPSELTPGVADMILNLWHESGLPPGVINGIQGDAITAQLLLQQDIQAVYFTGSYRAGLQIHQQFSHRPDILLALEMGGNNPLIVDAVSDITAAVYHTIVSAFITAGQRCTCARRLIVRDDDLGDAFLKSLIDATQNIRVGPYTDNPEPFMGPVIRYEQALNHLNAQKQLQQLGGRSLLKLSLLKENTGLLSPGIIDMTGIEAPDEEIFAPFLQVYRYRNFDEALSLANNTRYGLVAGLLSDDSKRYQTFYHAIRAGLLSWNRPTTGAASHLPFGGVGHSGNHRPSAYFAADYCAYPIASLEQPQLSMPKEKWPGITLPEKS